jgi:hypothetical protein
MQLSSPASGVIIKRQQWGAKPLTAYTSTIRPALRTRIVIHHSVTSEGTSQAQVESILRRIDDQHRGNGWGGIGYNLAVDYDGRVYEARGIDIQGAHARGANTNGYGIVYIGDGRKGITPKAVDAIKGLVASLQRHSSKKLDVVGHKDVNSTACPGDKIYDLVKSGSFNMNYPLSPVAPPPPPPPPIPGGIPVNGKLDRVTWRAWQNVLKAKYGYLGVIDGIPGPLTWRAVQRSASEFYKGPIDGIPGPMTRRGVQQKLAKTGHYKGRIDGVWGPLTISAIQRSLNDGSY